MTIYEQGSFKRENPNALKRRAESDKIRTKYPDRLPIILEQASSKDFPLSNDMKRKFLVPGELTVGQFLYTVRKRLKLNAATAVFLSTSKGKRTVMHPTSRLLGQIDDEYRNDEDGFLYMVYCGENTFG